jgi:hypothetical protein
VNTNRDTSYGTFGANTLGSITTGSQCLPMMFANLKGVALSLDALSQISQLITSMTKQQ